MKRNRETSCNADKKPRETPARDGAAGGGTTVVVRSVGERTEAKCIELLSAAFGAGNVFLVKNVTPFSKAIGESFRIGIEKGNKWTLIVDADVLAFKDEAKKFADACDGYEKSRPNTFCFAPMLFDLFLNKYRPVGMHMYRTKLLKPAMKFVAGGTNDMRPESYVKKMMNDIGYRYYRCPERLGIHDFFQYPKSIVKKIILHCRKHPHDYMDLWKDPAGKPDDFKWAAEGIKIYEQLGGGDVVVDNDFMNALVDRHGIKFPETGEIDEAEIQAALKKYNMQENPLSAPVPLRNPTSRLNRIPYERIPYKKTVNHYAFGIKINAAIDAARMAAAFLADTETARLLVNLLCGFVPSKNMRHRIRAGFDNIRSLNSKKKKK